MDLLRTQKIRAMIELHKEMKSVTSSAERSVTIGKVFAFLEQEPNSVKRNEVWINFIVPI